jgi:hypothetical protein
VDGYAGGDREGAAILPNVHCPEHAHALTCSERDAMELVAGAGASGD